MTTTELVTTCWALDPFAVLASSGAVLAYVMWARRAPRAGAAERQLGTRAIAFSAALLLFVLALVSPIGTLANGYLFSAHMLQHLMLVLVVPPLALLGLGAREPSPSVAGRASGPLSRAALHPALTWGLGVGAMWLWHAPTLCNAASRGAVMLRVQELSLLGMGTLFWLPIVGPITRARLSPLAGALYLFTACVACTLLGILVTFSPVEVCSIFLHPVDRLGVMPLLREGWGLSAARDQQLGGLFMWVPACLIYGAGILGLLARWYRSDAQLETPHAIASSQETS